MKRVRRTLLQRLQYLAIYQCKDCKEEESVPRRFRLHLGSDCCCPKCATQKLTKLRERDHIDPMMGGLLNLVERLAGGKLYHCRFCRIQFYDRRNPKTRESEDPRPLESPEVVTPPNTASSGA
jgi:hypothetical protein